MGGFSAILGKQSTRLAERRVVDMNGNTVTCPGDLVTMAFFTYTVDLRPPSVAVADSPEAGTKHITRPTRPVGR